jgi:hypothetical protein
LTIKPILKTALGFLPIKPVNILTFYLKFFLHLGVGMSTTSGNVDNFADNSMRSKMTTDFLAARIYLFVFSRTKVLIEQMVVSVISRTLYQP